ncbi:MAG TPA: TolC family protein [Gemmatimonadaceae bacterium]|nr:TolC family protein [Gemmatimonadaceae bacterium]
MTIAYRLILALLLCLTAFGESALAQRPAGGAGGAGATPSDSRGASALTLGALLDSVAARHPLVGAARARVRAAHGSRRAAGTFANPVLGYDVENAPLPGGASPTMDREVMTTVMLPLEELYQRGPRVRRAAAEWRAAAADAAATEQRIALDAASAYFRTALAQVGLDAAHDVSAWLDTVVVYNRSRVREGVTAEADLIRSEVERDRAAADATMQEAELARARADLSAFMGDPANLARSDFVVVVDDRALVMPSTTTAGTAAGRPEVRAARERASAANAGVSAERSMSLRQLGATIGTKQTEGVSTLVAGVSLPVPIFDQNRGNRERANAERDAARLELVSEERTASATLIGATLAAQLLSARVATMSARDRAGRVAHLARADEARRIALGAYREGAVPLFQVIDAARTWAEARVAYYRLIYAQQESVLALLVAQGTPLSSATALGDAQTNRSTPR